MDDQVIELRNEWREKVGPRAAESLGAVESLFGQETDRVERIEDKLSRHGDFIAVLLPLVVGLAGGCLVRKLWTAFGLATAGASLLALAEFTALAGAATFQIFTPTSDDLVADVVSDTPELARSARLLAYCDANVPRGTRLNNLITAVQRTLFQSIILAAVATGMLGYSISAH